ncbi:MAG: serine/threonine protein kinase [Archangiaceae bacterium]|nr:serine/threonine protein kinase [Archangiaceae bacterium]
MAGPNQFGKYELQSRLAAGGMAEIFKARYPVAAGISKAVVIKRILPHYAANKQFIQMFTNEARIVMGLSHGNIAQVFDFGEIDGDWFIAMEYVDGQPLSKVLKRARTVGIQAFPTSFAVLVTIEMLKGLHYAHTRFDDSGKALKIVHRDVSPQNVLVSYEGQVKLVDFGIAKAKTAGREETESGAVKGKYSYFSPEQARGKELDARTDVFAAGIVLYEMLCGQLPFQGRMIDTMSRIVKGQFAPPRTLNPDITPALEQIMLTALAHDREKRYANAEAFQGALSSYLYQNAPSFQSSSLGSFVQFLFEPDLVAEGRPVMLQREFLDQVALWKKPLPAVPTEPSPQETAWGKDPQKSSGRKSSHSGPSPVTSEALARPPLPTAVRHGLLALALLSGVGFSLAGWSIWSTTGTFSLELSSQPSGASIFIDGAPWPKKTPTLLELDAASPHELELTFPGMRDWSRSVSRRRNERSSMHAELEKIEMSAPPVVPDAGVVAEPVVPVVESGPPRSAGLPDVVFKVYPKAHAVKIPETKAARLKLNPSHTYRIWTEGRASLGGMASPIWVTDVGYFVQGPNVSARESFGQLGPKSTVIKGATMLYAFLMDHAIDDNSGVIKVKVKNVKGGPTETLVVNAAQNVVLLEPNQRMTYVGFNNLTAYSVRPLENGPAPRTRGERGGTVSKVLVTQQSGFNVFEGRLLNDDAVRVFELGKMYKVKGTGFIWLTFPDDDLDDNSGSIDVEVIPGGNPIGGFRLPLPGAGTAFGQ